jgi:hypothetical protein
MYFFIILISSGIFRCTEVVLSKIRIAFFLSWVYILVNRNRDRSYYSIFLDFDYNTYLYVLFTVVFFELSYRQMYKGDKKTIFEWRITRQYFIFQLLFQLMRCEELSYCGIAAIFRLLL